jgi:hypothetical protein
MSNLFYVYEHWRLDKDECFYVGKGKQHRAYSKSGRNQHWHNIVGKLDRIGSGYEVKLVATGLTESEAFFLEKERIAFWRDKTDLCNKTDGGDGVSGLVMSEESRQKMSEKAKGRPGNPSMLGRKHSAETKAKMSLAQKGVPKSPEHIAKLVEVRKGKKHTVSAAGRASMSKAFKGRKLSDQARENMRLGWIKRKLKSTAGVV